MPKPYPEEFRRDVVAVARKREAPLGQIAKGRNRRGRNQEDGRQGPRK